MPFPDISEHKRGFSLEAYKIENLTFTYPGRKEAALRDVSLTIRRGEFVTLCGPSGCGKTTLLRCLKPSAAPHGVMSGVIYFDGVPLEKLTTREASAKIGFVLQSPENQIVTDKVWHELAFGLESLGFATTEIRLRVAEMASFFGMHTWFRKSVAELSGGQKQLLALASVMALQPRVLILDEPTSQLDPIAAGEFLAAVGRINRELGVTVIITEHRLEEVFPLSSRVAVMDRGRLVTLDSPAKIGLKLCAQNHKMMLAMPTPMRVWVSCQNTQHSPQDLSPSIPVTVQEGAQWISGKTADADRIPKRTLPKNRCIAISLVDVWFRYEKNLPDIVQGLSFDGHYGEITAILGGNGVGKTTVLSLISGLITPIRGKIHADTTVYTLPQNPQSLFVAKTVREDLLEILSERDMPKDEQAENITCVVDLCRLEGLLDSHPYDLSGGEQQRAALAKVLLLQPKILLLDEPTKGLDAEYKQTFAAILRKLVKDGAAVIIVSHDIEFCAEHTERCALFFDGDIVAENTPREFFSGNSFYTTGANRMARHVLPDAVTVKDILYALGADVPTPVTETMGAETQKSVVDNSEQHSQVDNMLSQQRCVPKHTVVASAIILLTIPLTIFFGIYLLDDRRFALISVLIILQAMLPFAIMFEGRKPQARELVVIAVLSAIAVAGRAAFFMLPQFKPVVAIVIIAGVALGPEAGFLVGAATGFVSNMLLGQGPWTPWQMFAFGLIGFLGGIVFRKRPRVRTPVPLALFGGFLTFVVYGGIMNPASVLMFQPTPTVEMFIVQYLRGVPFDLVHAAATVVFLLIISRPMLEKLDRIKSKYGL